MTLKTHSPSPSLFGEKLCWKLDKPGDEWGLGAGRELLSSSFLRLVCETNLCSCIAGAGLRASPGVGSIPVLQLLPACSRKGGTSHCWEQDLWPLQQGRKQDVLFSCWRGKRCSTQASMWCSGKCSTRLLASHWGQGNTLEVPIPCCRGQSNHCRSQMSCLNEEFGIWPRADEPDAEPAMEHRNSPYCNHSKAVQWWKWAGKCEVRRERGKMRAGLCLLHLLGFIRGAAAGRAKASGRQGRKQNKPAPLTLILNKQARLVPQPLSYQAVNFSLLHI